MGVVDCVGLLTGKLVDGRDDVPDDRPGVYPADVDHSAFALLAEFHSRLLALCGGLAWAANQSLPYLIAALVLVMLAGFVHLVWIPLHLAAFFAGALACHGTLARMRPLAWNLSVFYVTIALGGVARRHLEASLVAPILFNRIVEYPLALTLACLIVPATRAYWSRGTSNTWLADLLFAAVVFGLTLVLATNQAKLSDSVLGVIGVMIASGLGFLACKTADRRPIRFALVVAGVLVAGGLTPGVNGRLLHIERDFFGVLRVTHDTQQNANRLFHGSTLHGQQSLDPAYRHEPSTYFTRSGPIGQLFHAMERRLNPSDTRVAIVGLGSGPWHATQNLVSVGLSMRLTGRGTHCSQFAVFHVSTRLQGRIRRDRSG